MKKKAVTVASLLAEKSAPPRFDREWLLQSLLGVNRAELLMSSDRELSKKELSVIKKWFLERKRGVPLQYVAGATNFYGLSITISKKVLIPRPETEVLVDVALKLGDELGENNRVLDVGVGSGAIALALKNARQNWIVCASDVSSAALAMAKKNSARLNLSVDFYKSDLLKKFYKQNFDLIISNPPYVNPTKDRVEKSVHRYEPHLALYPETRLRSKGLRERGAWAADKIIADIAAGKVSCKYLALELSPRVALCLEKRWRVNPAVKRIWREKDLSGRSRFLLIAWSQHG